MTKPSLQQAQATRILRALGDWISGSPGRSVTIGFDAGGWRVQIDDSRQTRGTSIADALAQASQVVGFEVSK
jgi:hypothetical protein